MENKVIDMGSDYVPEEEKRGTDIIKVTTMLQVPRDELDNIMVCALEGGISYWCDHVEVKDEDFRGCAFASETVSRGATLCIYDAEDDEVWELDRAGLLKGLAKFIASNLCRDITINDNVVCTDGIDSEDADMIVQLALFGDIVYG